ncbi:hypothetical protein BO70DRAFT_357248 [Aspergillus heteromorphus CBS 117.55]|uniref:Uncharacterized protein n=1 Tax=Aspergillus heteromorphus CBS 117.55 TaxID=1448321 RepID=A0A317X3M7_9EURO|nr:uncharacterized protein BO70DRAFT_357248 [Aspergillus heteromorphus CBS 117.55]PWY92107.1 hypothetical protein BO70DRAFT_357248 [Aspergillus heteromorphus CBS 117.55]
MPNWYPSSIKSARLAQSAERETLNLKVAGSTPALGFSFCSFPTQSPYLGVIDGERDNYFSSPQEISCPQDIGTPRIRTEPLQHKCQ